MYIIDFEASGLGPASYPIEVAWGLSPETVVTFLLNPQKMPSWTDWNPKSAEFHHISREMLIEKGEDPHTVAARMVQELSGKAVYSDEPKFDNFWKDRLLSDAGFDPTAIRIQNLKYYLNKIIKTRYPGKRYMDLVQEFSTAQCVFHRAGSDVVWLMRFVEFIRGLPDQNDPSACIPSPLLNGKPFPNPL